MNNLIVFATYWNEIEWIKPSLNQILKIDPIEIIICDGNFDPNVKNYSTDGTREVIEKFVADNKERAQLISAERTKSFNRGCHFYREAGRKNNIFLPSRLKYAFASQFKINEYRVNQSITFSKMMSISKRWQEDRWCMSLDADQFYTDELIEKFSITNEKTDYDLITADEWTFPQSFREFTTKYETRTWNNMPHKIKKNMAVYPTRHFVTESMWGHQHYNKFAKCFHAGTYHHYKFRENLERLQAGYQLGDRKPPNNERYSNLKEYTGVHPEVIREHFNI